MSIHAARTGRDDRMLDRRRISLLKPTAYLVNVARGALTDEDALAEALDRGALAGAALDVLADEPPAPDNRLLHHPRVLRHAAQRLVLGRGGGRASHPRDRRGGRRAVGAAAGRSRPRARGRRVDEGRAGPSPARS